MASAHWECRELLQPLTDERPCGESLEDTELLAAFDAYDLFGHSTPIDAPPEPGERRVPKPPESPVWAEIKQKSLDALGKSKDLRLLAYLAAALLRTDGLLAFCESVKVAAAWLDMFWSEVYPQVDEDAFFRRNALSCLADPMAVLDRLRKVPLVDSRQHGRVSVRDLEIAAGQASPADGEAPLATAQIEAALASLGDEELRAAQDGVNDAVEALRRIDGTMTALAGSDAAPGLEGVSAPLGRMAKVLRAQIAQRSGGSVEAGEAAGAEGGAVAVGAIRSREEAMRAMDAVAEYFRRHEPSSPVPMIVDRAKRLVGRDFLDVLADIAPEALASARAAGGVRAGD